MPPIGTEQPVCDIHKIKLGTKTNNVFRFKMKKIFQFITFSYITGAVFNIYHKSKVLLKYILIVLSKSEIFQLILEDFFK